VSKTGGRSQAIATRPKSAGIQPDLSSWARRESRKIPPAGLGSHQKLLINDLRRGRSLCHEGQLEVVDDLHRPVALRAEERVKLADFAHPFGPTFWA